MTTADGEPVDDLTADDFELLDDGKPCRSAACGSWASRNCGGPIAPIRNGDDEEREASRDDVRVFAILLDDYHVARRARLRVIPAV